MILSPRMQSAMPLAARSSPLLQIARRSAVGVDGSRPDPRRDRVSDPARPFWPNVARKSLSKPLIRLKMGSDMPRRAKARTDQPAVAGFDPRQRPGAALLAERRPEKSLQALDKAQNGLGHGKAWPDQPQAAGSRPSPATGSATRAALRPSVARKSLSKPLIRLKMGSTSQAAPRPAESQRPRPSATTGSAIRRGPAGQTAPGKVSPSP